MENNTPINKTANYTTAAAQTAIWSPAAGVVPFVTDLIVAATTPGTQVVTVTIGTAKCKVVVVAGMPNVHVSFGTPLTGSAGSTVVITTTETTPTTVTVCGYEETF